MAPQRTVLITGSSDGGLGSALALAFHAAGWRVFASARNTNKLNAMKATSIETLSLDVSSTASLSAAVSQISSLTNGTLDALVNNAGSGYSMPLIDIDISAAKSVFDLNVWSVIATTQAFLPLLLGSAKEGNKPMVINNTSIAAILPMPIQSVYNSSKAAIASMTDSLRMELAPFGIKVVDLRTGAVKTNFFKNIAGSDKAPHLPEGSIYGVARKEIESMMSGEGFFEQAENAEDWAKNVVRDLSKKNTPNQVWRGMSAGMARWAQNAPQGWLDGVMSKRAGLNAVEKGLKAQRGES